MVARSFCWLMASRRGCETCSRMESHFLRSSAAVLSGLVDCASVYKVEVATSGVDARSADFRNVRRVACEGIEGGPSGALWSRIILAGAGHGSGCDTFIPGAARTFARLLFADGEV